MNPIRTGPLTAAFLALAVLLGLAVPPIRSGFVTVVHSMSGGAALAGSAKALEPTALAHPSDPDVWLAFASALSSEAYRAKLVASYSEPRNAKRPAKNPSLGVKLPPEAKTTPAAAWEKALAAGPRSAPVLMRAAIHELWQAPKLDQDRTPEEGPAPKPTPQQMQSLGRAVGLLAQCRAVAPDNAACDYLLAWAELDEHQEAQALAALKSATARPHWTLYDRETGMALLKLFDQAGVPPGLSRISAASAELSVGTLDLWSRLRSMARAVVALGDAARKSGDHPRALDCYEALLHLGHIMRVDSTTLIEGLVGVAISAIASGSVISKDELARVQKEARDSDRRLELAREARTTAFAAYAEEHGRPDLARFCIQDSDEDVAWRADAKVATKQMMPELVRSVSGGGTLNAAAIWASTAGILLVGIIVGLLSLALRYWREEPAGPVFGYGLWLALLALVVLPSQVAVSSLGALLHALSVRQVTETAAGAVLGGAVLLLSLLAWVIVVVVIALGRHDAASPEQPRRSAFRASLAGLRAVLPPTLAALILFSVIALYPVQRQMERLEQHERQMVEQGEVKYWNIGTGKVHGPEGGNGRGQGIGDGG